MENAENGDEVSIASTVDLYAEVPIPPPGVKHFSYEDENEIIYGKCATEISGKKISFIFRKILKLWNHIKFEKISYGAQFGQKSGPLKTIYKIIWRKGVKKRLWNIVSKLFGKRFENHTLKIWFKWLQIWISN